MMQSDLQDLDDAIADALQDAQQDGDGRARPERLRVHLERHGLAVIKAPQPLTRLQVQDRLRAFDESYRLEYDVVRCIGCKRTCHIDCAAEDFQHARGCRHDDAPKRPWQVLAEALSNLMPQIEETDHGSR